MRRAANVTLRGLLGHKAHIEAITGGSPDLFVTFNGIDNGSIVLELNPEAADYVLQELSAWLKRNPVTVASK